MVASNIDTKGGRCLTTSVGYYDSGRPLTVSVKMRKTICSFLKCEAAFLNFDIVNVMEQPNTYDCGFSKCHRAGIYECDPALCRWDCSNMRQHLLHGLEKGRMERFPTLGMRRVPFGSRIRKSISEEVLCNCRMPNEKLRAMIQCDWCGKYYHMDCMELDDQRSYHDVDWKCHVCLNMLDKLGN